MGKIKIKEVRICRAEGLIKECGIEFVAPGPTTAGADKVLARMALTAPEQGKGYHKTDFQVLWDDDASYKGTICLWAEYAPGDLARQMRTYLRRSWNKVDYQEFTAEREF